MANLSGGPHSVAEDLGIKAGKEHQADDPVGVAQSATPQQQIGNIQSIASAVSLDHSPLKHIQPTAAAAAAVRVGERVAQGRGGARLRGQGGLCSQRQAQPYSNASISLRTIVSTTACVAVQMC